MLSTDYELLVDLLKKELRVICFCDVNESFGSYRKMYTAISMRQFDGLYLGFNEEGFEGPYKEYCKKINLKFIPII